MKVEEQIKNFISGVPEPKRTDIETLHKHILKVLPKCKLWFESGINSEGKTVTNPTIGYGFQTLKYANGTTRGFFQIGMGANATGIFVYILPVKDKTYLAETYGKKIGKASMSGYAIKFKTLKDINLDVLGEAIRTELSSR